MSAHILVDLDGTLALYESGWAEKGIIGEPVPWTAARVRYELHQGTDMRVFTARVSIDPDGTIFSQIQDWTEKHFGVRLPVTCSKGYDTVEIWDDRAVSFEHNTGRTVRWKESQILVEGAGITALLISRYRDMLDDQKA